MAVQVPIPRHEGRGHPPQTGGGERRGDFQNFSQGCCVTPHASLATVEGSIASYRSKEPRGSVRCYYGKFVLSRIQFISKNTLLEGQIDPPGRQRVIPRSRTPYSIRIQGG